MPEEKSLPATESQSEVVVLGLGGNMGDPELWFRRTVAVFCRYLDELRVAPLYRTTAVSPIAQRDYLNTVILGTTSLEPESLLAIAKSLELAAGRRSGARLAPRPLDIDLLLFGKRVMRRPELRLPHPRLSSRRFVLAPLADLRPDHPIPPHSTPVRRLLARLPPDEHVTRISWKVFPG